ncbi:MAG: LysR family transcriptional regulator [Microbacteriaceae bacterium]|nr:LysR family transcriptional regulator [Microbacteriaceae bacterium]
MVNPTHLTTLVAVLRTGSFAGAARELGYTGSAVSQQIAALERETGLQLFDRDARGIRPTAIADQLQASAHDVFAAIASFDERVRSLGEGGSGLVRLGSFPTASRQFVPSALAEFVRSRPGVELELDEGEPDDLVPRLVEREIDLALAYQYDLVPASWPRSLTRLPLLSEQLVAFVPPGHPASGRGIELAELADETWIATRDGSHCAQALERACATAGFEPRIRYRSNNYSVVASFVRSGLGVAVIPALAALSLSDGETDTAEIVDLGVRRHVSMLVDRQRGNPAVAALVDALVQIARRTAARAPGIALAPELRVRADY